MAEVQGKMKDLSITIVILVQFATFYHFGVSCL